MTKCLTKKAIVIMLLQWVILSLICTNLVFVVDRSRYVFQKHFEHIFELNIHDSTSLLKFGINNCVTHGIHRKFLDGRAMKSCTLEYSICSFTSCWRVHTRKICKIKYRVIFWQVMHFILYQNSRWHQTYIFWKRKEINV